MTTPSERAREVVETIEHALQHLPRSTKELGRGVEGELYAALPIARALVECVEALEEIVGGVYEGTGLTSDEMRYAAELVEALVANGKLIVEHGEAIAERDTAVFNLQAEKSAHANDNRYLIQERDTLSQRVKELEEGLKKWLQLHAWKHTPRELFALADETRARLGTDEALEQLLSTKESE